MSNTVKKQRILVLFGGRSGEHEVSLVSASSVLKHLDPEKYDIVPVGITKEGKWIAGPDSMQMLKSGNTPEESNAIIAPEPQDITKKLSEQGIGNIDVVFPVMHGPYAEDGTIQGFLELTGIPYVGCGTLASAVCMDKVMQKKVLQAEGFEQTPYVWFWMQQWNKDQDILIEKIEKELTYPLFVKPANMGSSVGVNKATDTETLIQAITEAGEYDRKILVEQGVSNPREIECAVLGNQDPQASVLGEIKPSNDFYDYNAKYVDGKSDAYIPAELESTLAEQIQKLALKAYTALDCEGLARVDFLLSDDSTPYINELNTMPGFTSISMYPKLWEATGIAYPELLDRLIDLAKKRHTEKANLKVSYTPKEDWYTA